ncbi:MAG: ABC transporter ATP-binding protein [Spirochaetaceae bacterium]|jgi:energy-coupling factor transport system ATP-binding protein|nr:ABC transporter ATP-binding protein [Spirochaetaceae bacterium]
MKGQGADPVLVFKDFTFQYQAQAEPTLYDINLTVRRGEKILILGPSGSGKSTLAHCINGLVPHAFKGRSSGSLTIAGKDARTLDIFAISGIVGTVLQDTDGQFVGLSAGEDIAFAAENDMVPWDEMRRRVAEAARLVDMEGHLAKSPQDLSGGQKQRISLAGILLMDTEILLFDEPLANLDPAAGKEAVELIHRLQEETGKTVLIVEHRLEDVLHRPVDRIVVIDRGRIIADLPPPDLLAADLLRKTGIREPLYLSALRCAGLEIRAEDRPEDPAALRFDAGRLRSWAGELPPEKTAAVAPPLLELRDLRFRYGAGEGPPALDGVSFTLARGECAALAGENGAGKSTLAALICGFHRPLSGQILLRGRDLASLSIKERAEHIGFVLQNPNRMISFPLIFDETALGLRNRGVGEGEIRDRVQGILHVCGLYPFRNWPVSALSYGQKKRLTIASILVLRPSLLILDEPTAGQDYRHYSDIMEFLRRLNQEQDLTLLLITHDMYLMLEYARHALVLAQGKLIADDAPSAVLTDGGVIARGRLKETSLSDLARRSGIADGALLVRRFIRQEALIRSGRQDRGFSS